MGPGVRRDDEPYCVDGHAMTSRLRPGVIAAIVVLALDQASKLWLLYVFDLPHRGAVKVTPFFDLVLAWNVGISFGWFQSDNQATQIILMIIKAVAVIVLAIWMARSRTLIATVAMLSASGCSALFVNGPPAHPKLHETIDCTQQYAGPVIDGLLAGFEAGRTIYAATLNESAYRGQALSRPSDILIGAVSTWNCTR